MNFLHPTTKIWYAISFFVVTLDQLLKYYFNENFLPYQQVPVFPFFSWTLAFNTGSAFSFLSDASGWQRWFFIAVALFVSVVLCFWLARLRGGQWLNGLSLSLILGGAVGNLCDRVVLGYVVDFILVHYENYYFPAFNLADASITLGVILMLIDEVKK